MVKWDQCSCGRRGRSRPVPMGGEAILCDRCSKKRWETFGRSVQRDIDRAEQKEIGGAL